MAEKDPKDTKLGKGVKRYGNGPKIKEGKAETSGAGKPEPKKEAASTGDTGKKDGGAAPQPDEVAGTTGIPVNERHSAERDLMVGRHSKERSQMSSRHDKEYADLAKMHADELKKVGGDAG